MRFFLRATLVAGLTLSLGGAALAAPEAPFRFDQAPGRLPKDVVPLTYTINVTPDPEHLTLRGSETVTLDVRHATRTIVFNALHMTYNSATVDGVAAAAVVPNDATQRTTLTTRTTLTPGRHVLVLAYRGKMETEPIGLFRQNYLAPGGKAGTMISTQFESTDARRMFPCWDEPAFRARFSLSVTTKSAWTAISNTPVVARVTHGKTTTTTFGWTPKMASYLVVLSAGDLAGVSGVDTHGTRHEVWAVRGQETNATYALKNSIAILAAYDDYFGVKFPLPKLNSIAVPGGFGGAMENWGGITYNDQILLLPPTATIGQRKEIYSVQAHEMAHQWFGDLVTMGWWDDLWLNESFASWMSARQTDLANPTWKWWEEEDGSKEGAMNADARITSHPIQTHVENELDADAAFDSEITYSKGEAFLRMLEQYLGPDTFRTGIRSYMQARKYSNATGADLWNALSAASGKNVAAIADAWISQAGFPLVNVTATCDASGNRTIALHQERFLLAGNDPEKLWQIPVGIASGNGAPTYTLLTKRDQGGIAAGRCDEPLRANAGDVGFYRVAYDSTTLAVNAHAFTTLPDADKIALLDDQWALTTAGKADIGTFLAMASAMGDDRDDRAWTIIVGSLGQIERYERGTPNHDAFAAYARSILKPLITTLGWQPKPGDTSAELRQSVIAALGQWGDPDAIAYAHARFADFVRNRASLPPDQQSAVLTTVATYADEATFEQLHTIAKTAHDQTEGERFYGALMRVRDPKLAQRALAIPLSSEIPPQVQEGQRLGLISAVTDWNPLLAYTFFKAHDKEIFSKLDVQSQVGIAQFLPVIFWNAAPLDELQTWVTGLAPQGSAPYIARGMERARFQAELKQRLVHDADAAVHVAHA
jgi:aminopeptidase N